MHDGDQRCGGTQRAPDVVQPNDPVRAHRQPGDFHAFTFQLCAGIEHGGMLDGAGNYMLWPGGTPDHPEDSQVVRLGSAACKDNFAGIATQPRRHLPPRGFQALLGRLSKMVDTGRVAADFDQRCR